MRSKVIIVMLLCICISLTVADKRVIRLQRRDEPTISSSTASGTATTVSDNKASATPLSEDNASKSSTLVAVTTSSDSTSASNSTSSTTSSSTTAVASSLNGASSSSTSYSAYNSTLTPDELPIDPKITPGFAIAGVILMITGFVYAGVGIKNKFLHVILSAAYLASISVLVLIIYVMNTPISDAVQGAYLVAIVVTGLILGGAAPIVPEMTEGLGCLLGGFCFSMWLLTLTPGGLLTETSSKAIFIGAFTLAGFATSFSHYTRTYGLIISISFSGATAIVLGIDCFSRAGLKEFWVYLWALNDNLFPLGATTYPVTRGIRVETAAIIIFFLAGIVSQMKLWKIIQKHRAQQLNEKKEAMRNIEEEEENLGRVIEHANAQERDQWEKVYGDRTRAASSAQDSGIGDMDSQKKGVSSVRTRSVDEDIELVESPRMMTGISNNGQEGAITVRVVRDLDPAAEAELEALQAELRELENSSSPKQSSTVQGSEGEDKGTLSENLEARLESQSTRRSFRRGLGLTKVPDVIPLPFKVSEGEIDDNASSVATYADEDQEPRGDARRSSSRKLSTASALIRKLSKKSQTSSRGYSIGGGESTEDLMVPHAVEEDRRSSLAATMDELSDNEDKLSVGSSLDEAPIVTEETNVVDETENEADVKSTALPGSKATIRPISEANLATDILEGTTEKPRSDKSVVSEVNSGSNGITKERLPPQLSKVVTSYRTNEWAKHLGAADAPDVDELKLAESPVETPANDKEKSVPVNVEELQQTATNATLPPAPRIVSQSNISATKSALASKVYPTQLLNTAALSRSFSQHSIAPQGSSSPKGFRSSSQPHMSQAIVESPIEMEFPAYSYNPRGSKFVAAQNQIPFIPTTTLMGKRDTMIRNKTNCYAGHQQSGPTAIGNNPYQQYVNRPISFSRGNSDAGSIHSYQNPSAILSDEDDDNMSLSARRDLIRQSTIMQASASGPPSAHQNPGAFDSHQPRRQSSIPSPLARDQQMASWRASVQQDLHAGDKPKVRATVERQRSVLWNERQQDEQRRAMQEWQKSERDSVMDARMRRGYMLDAHKEALMRMQKAANRSVQESS